MVCCVHEIRRVNLWSWILRYERCDCYCFPLHVLLLETGIQQPTFTRLIPTIFSLPLSHFAPIQISHCFWLRLTKIIFPFPREVSRSGGHRNSLGFSKQLPSNRTLWGNGLLLRNSSYLLFNTTPTPQIASDLLSGEKLSLAPSSSNMVYTLHAPPLAFFGLQEISS